MPYRDQVQRIIRFRREHFIINYVPANAFDGSNVLPLLLCVDAAHRALGFVVGWSASAIGFNWKKRREEKRRTNNIDQRGGVDAHHHRIVTKTHSQSCEQLQRTKKTCSEIDSHRLIVDWGPYVDHERCNVWMLKKKTRTYVDIWLDMIWSTVWTLIGSHNCSQLCIVDRVWLHTVIGENAYSLFVELSWFQIIAPFGSKSIIEHSGNVVHNVQTEKTNTFKIIIFL